MNPWPKITPSKGSLLWFYESTDAHPLPAFIAYINCEAGTINIAYLDALGYWHAKRNLPLLERDAVPLEGAFCRWPEDLVIQ